MHPYRYKLSLRCKHPTLSSSEICKFIDLEADIGQTVGQPRKTRKGQPLEGTYTSNYCVFELSEGNDSELLCEIEKWNKRFIAKLEDIREFNVSGGQMDYFLGLFLDGNSGFELNPEVTSVLSTLGITLGLDIYPPDNFTEKS